MTDQTTPEPPDPNGKAGATFLGFFDKYAPADELFEILRQAVLENRRAAAAEGQPVETE